MQIAKHYKTSQLHNAAVGRELCDYDLAKSMQRLAEHLECEVALLHEALSNVVMRPGNDPLLYARLVLRVVASTKDEADRMVGASLPGGRSFVFEP